MCGCQCDDSELGEVLINPQPVPVFQVWRAGVTLIKFGDVRKQVCSEEVQGLRRKWGSFWGRAPHVHASRTCICWPNRREHVIYLSIPHPSGRIFNILNGRRDHLPRP